MKPDQYRIQMKTETGFDQPEGDWTTMKRVYSYTDSAPFKTASSLSNDFPEAHWRVLRYSPLLDDWTLVWERSAEKTKPTEFEHEGVAVAPGDNSGLWVKSVGRYGAEVYLDSDEVAALRAYFASEGE